MALQLEAVRRQQYDYHDPTKGEVGKDKKSMERPGNSDREGGARLVKCFKCGKFGHKSMKCTFQPMKDQLSTKTEGANEKAFLYQILEDQQRRMYFPMDREVPQTTHPILSSVITVEGLDISLRTVTKLEENQGEKSELSNLLRRRNQQKTEQEMPHHMTIDQWRVFTLHVSSMEYK